MFHVPIARLAVAALVFHSIPARAEQIAIDLPGAIERAHRAAPEAIASRGQVAIAEANVTRADLPFTSNPEIDGGAGPRLTGLHPIDADIRIDQNLEPWRRGPRRSVARADVVHARAQVDADLRALDLEVAQAFYEALFAEQATQLSRRVEQLAKSGADAALRRRGAGEITDLEANLARAAHGRARSAVEAADAERSLAIGRLAALIAASPDDTIKLRGELRPTENPGGTSSIARRPDVRLLDAERNVARGELDVARSNALPEIALWAGYRREDTNGIVLAGLRVSLPLWNRSQGEKAAATAREHRAIETRQAVLRVANRQVADARATQTAAKGSLEAFEHDVLPLLDESEQLLQKSIDAGQIAISDYLVARQEILNGRREHLERLLALAKAAASLRYAEGISP
jgi:cobalt-zinc-cadmium efflux system outer membrane protein